jgi:hypothetical protein
MMKLIERKAWILKLELPSESAQTPKTAPFDYCVVVHSALSQEVSTVFGSR